MATNATTHLFNLKWSLAMKRIDFRKTLGAAVLIGGSMIAASAIADQAQGAGRRREHIG
jgi:hypothetical protein